MSLPIRQTSEPMNVTLQSLEALPAEMATLLAQLGEIWAHASDRPQVAKPVNHAWDALINDWIVSDLPLVIRKGGRNRGTEFRHQSGRQLVVADNSPAHCAFSCAIRGETYDIDGIHGLLERDEIPFALATKKLEKATMRYKRTLGARDSVNKRGWKLCHIDNVGLSTKTPLEAVPIETLCAHFRRFLAPSNQFVVPLRWGGLGEVSEFVEGVRKFELQGLANTVLQAGAAARG